MDYSKLNNIAASIQDVENASNIVENKLKNLIELIETVTSTALTDLDNKVDTNERAVSAALNDLDDKVTTLENAGKNLATLNAEFAEGIANASSSSFSGDYGDLANKPSLAAVATSGAYSDLSGTPSLATVATSGEYSDLIGKPNIITKKSGEKGFSTSSNSHATGNKSFAEGASNTASGSCSHAEGSGTTASGNSSHSFGDGCMASGDNSIAGGESSISAGNNSFAFGVVATTGNEDLYVFGKYNKVISGYHGSHFAIGNGSAGSTSNTFQTLGDYVYVKGVGGFDGTNVTNGLSTNKSLSSVITDVNTRLAALEGTVITAEDVTYDSSETYTSGTVGYAIKTLQTAVAGVSTYSAGTGISISNNTISVDATQLSYNDLLDKLVRDVNDGKGVVIGGQCKSPCNVLNGKSSVAMGDGAIVADGYGAIAAGYITSAKGNGACANGTFTYAEGEGTHVEGNGLMDSIAIIREQYGEGDTDIVVHQAFPVGAIILNKDKSAILCYVTNCEEYGSYYKLTLSAGLDRNISRGGNILIIGYAKGIGAHAEGCGTIAKGNGTHAEGMYTVTNNDAEHACGKYNKSTPEVRIPGSANVSSYGTQFSIGIGSSYTQRVNAFEVLGNGNIYVKGLGNYDGTSISNVGTFTLLNVITGINTRVTTLENNTLVLTDQITETGSAVTVASLTPNEYHKWGELTSLTITALGSGVSGKMNEYMIEFESGSTATTLSLPSGITWMNNNDPTSNIHANKKYQISIVNNLGVYAEF